MYFFLQKTVIYCLKLLFLLCLFISTSYTAEITLQNHLNIICLTQFKFCNICTEKKNHSPSAKILTHTTAGKRDFPSYLKLEKCSYLHVACEIPHNPVTYLTLF